MARGRKKGGGGKLNRTEVVTIRLDPRLRYLLELAARTGRRTVSSFIEWAIDRMLREVSLPHDSGNGPALSVHEAAAMLWDVDEAERLALLATHYPELLTYDEQVRWKHQQQETTP